MKNQKSVLLSFILFTLTLFAQKPPISPPSGYHWEVVWEDNFDGDKLDETKWNTNYNWGTIDDQGGEVRGDNYIHPNHVEVADGVLRLKNSENLFPADYPDSNESNYRLMNKGNSLYIYPEEATSGSGIVQEAYGEFPNWDFSLWVLELISDMDYRIKNRGTGLYLSGADANLKQQTASSASDQQWTLTGMDEGWYTIMNVESGMYLSQDESGIIVNTTSTSDKELWKIFGKLQWIAGVVQNFEKISIHRPGYMEASLKMPASTGTWPAFWLLRSGWPPEIDILEYLSSTPEVVHNIHYVNESGSNASSIKQYTTVASEFNQSFRNFGFYMGSEDSGAQNDFIWYLDNQWDHQWWGHDFFDQFYDMYAIFSHGNGAWAGFPDANSTFPNYYEIDYFRYWELAVGCDIPTIFPYLQINDGEWQSAASATIEAGDKVALGPQPIEGSWEWVGCGTSGSNREQVFYPTNSCTATAILTNDCGGQTTQDFVFTVNGSECEVPVISPYIQVNGGNWENVSAITIAPGDQISLNPQTTGGTWTWFGCEVSGTTQILTLTPTSSCTFIATNITDCGARSNQVFRIIVDEALSTSGEGFSSLKMYPNPMTDHLFVEVPAYTSHSKIAIYDIAGRVVFTKKDLKLGRTDLNISYLNSGIYIVKFSNNKKIVTKKFIKK